MTLNRALIISFCILALLVLVTVNRHNRTKSDRIEYASAYDEIIMSQIHHIPEIVRSYEIVKGVYGKTNTLIFRYAYNSCNSCIIGYLAELIALQEEIGKEYVWIYPAYPDDRESRIQLSNELSQFNYRNIPYDSLHIPKHHGENKSYFAWLNDAGEIEIVFIPKPNKPQNIRHYFLEVKRKIQVFEEK